MANTAVYTDGETRVNQRDLACLECPLEQCDTGSLWCIVRFATDPNEAQQQFVNRTIRKRRSRVKRKDYFAEYYAANRERKLASANERNAALRTSTIRL